MINVQKIKLKKTNEIIKYIHINSISSKTSFFQEFYSKQRNTTVIIYLKDVILTHGFHT